jgi:TRAP transporter TAXI family solute receptor
MNKMIPWLMLFCLFLPFQSAAVTLHIVTGKPTGTYYQFGQDIKNALAEDIPINVMTSQGSLTNSMILCANTDRELGIIQADVLYSEHTRKMGCLANRLQLIFPLYAEEIHLIAGQHIQSIEDLNDKIVAVGSPGTGTHITSTRLMNDLGVKPKKLENLWETKALKALNAGEIDAMFYVIGYPASLLKKLPANSPIHLVPLAVPPDSQVFSPAQLPADTYPWQAEAVDIVAVYSMLVTHTYRQQQPRCQLIARLAKALHDKLPELQADGHPKWKNVKIDKDSLLKYQGVSDCALGGLGWR